MVETEDSDFVVTSMNGTECGLMDLDTRQHTDDPTTLEDMDADTTVTPFVTEDHTYNQPIRANPPKKASAYINYIYLSPPPQACRRNTIYMAFC